MVSAAMGQLGIHLVKLVHPIHSGNGLGTRAVPGVHRGKAGPKHDSPKRNWARQGVSVVSWGAHAGRSDTAERPASQTAYEGW